ncbi:MAG TPA: hypothetical protein VJJ77_05015, partial [Dongiaceae bacterium]|nr:hypothetical protein [Dongiaceae bacterium]
VGQGDLDRARQIYTRIDANRQSFLEAELDRAKASGDAQAGFRALVELRERSLKGEIDAFVNYLNLEWYKAGPARAYNLWIGMEGTQESLEWTTAEAGRLHSALIRASYNLPGALSEGDQVLLRRHGYVEGDGAGRYTIPDHARLVPTTVGSEFTAVTQRGPLATVDKLLNAQHLAELTATVALPGGIAGRFGRAVTAELLATGLVRSMGGKVLAYGIGTAAEAAAFTGLSRLGQVAVNPEMLTQGELWRPETLLREFAHNLVVIGALKLKGGATQVLQRASRGIERSLLRNTAQKVLAGSDIPAEAALLTALNAALESNSITQESFLENLGVIVLLRGMHPLTAGGESRWMRQAQARIDRHLRETGREVAPPERGRVGQTGEAWARFYEWVDAYYSPVQQLMVRFEGDWNAARKAYQNGEVTESQMRRMVQLRRQVVDALSDEIVKELGGEVQAFGSENLTSDYDISFVGPRAQVAVILFNARFNKRWAAAVDIGGRETGTVLDTNAYTGPEHANFLGGSRDVWFQDAFAHLAARKYLNDADWAGYRQRLLESAGADRRAGLSEMLDWVEARQREFKDATDRMRAEIAESGEVPAGDVEFAAQNRLYEQNLREIIELKDRYDRASGAERDALAQEIRNAQSKALYFAQEAYQTQAAIDHVVMTIQAAKRAITVESLMSDTPPELSIPLTPDQARQSYLEQIANMMKELSHEGDPAKLAAKAAKYLVRGLDAVRIARVNLGDFRAVVESTVELNDNRADLDKVRELLQTRFGENGADAYLRQVYDAVNQLTALLYGGGPSARVASAEGRSAGPPGQPPSESSGLATVPPPAEAGTGESPATPPAKPVTAQSVDAPRQRGPPAGEEGIATLPPGQERVAAPQGRESTPSPLAAAGPRRLVLLDPTTGQGERIQLGRRIGGGAFNDVYEIEGQPDRVIRISKESAGSDAAKVDAFGRQALDQANPELVAAPRRFGGFDVVGVEGGGAGVLGARAEIVRRVPETARDQLSRNPDGKMTAGQAIAFDRATRELNRLGFVWLDNHRNNYWLEDLPGTDNWRVVIFDTGGIVKMRGGPEQAADAARRFQQALNAPPPEQADLFQRTRNAAGNIKDLVSAGYREELLERFGADIDVEAIFGQPSGTDNANKIGFRTDGVAAFENVQDLARVNDPAALDRAYRSLRDGGAVPAPAEAAAPTPQQAALDAARAEHAAGLKALSGEPAYRSLLDALKTPEEVAGLADVGMARQFMSPQARTEADAALAIVNATLAADPSVSGVNAVALARYINLRAGRGVAGGPREAGV